MVYLNTPNLDASPDLNPDKSKDIYATAKELYQLAKILKQHHYDFVDALYFLLNLKQEKRISILDGYLNELSYNKNILKDNITLKDHLAVYKDSNPNDCGFQQVYQCKEWPKICEHYKNNICFKNKSKNAKKNGKPGKYNNNGSSTYNPKQQPKHNQKQQPKNNNNQQQ